MGNKSKSYMFIDEEHYSDSTTIGADDSQVFNDIGTLQFIDAGAFEIVGDALDVQEETLQGALALAGNAMETTRQSTGDALDAVRLSTGDALDAVADLAGDAMSNMAASNREASDQIKGAWADAGQSIHNAYQTAAGRPTPINVNHLATGAFILAGLALAFKYMKGSKR